MFVPLRLISYASAIGIISTIFLIFVVFYDGFSKPTAPGSLYDPAPTDVAVTDSMKLGAAFGLFMSGVSYGPVGLGVTSHNPCSSLDMLLSLT